MGREGDARGRRGGDVTPGRMPSGWSFVRIYGAANAIEFFVSLAAVIGGVAFLTMPEARDASAVANASRALSWTWTITYTIGGLAIVVGILTSFRTQAWRLELAGLYLLTGGFAGNGVAVAWAHPGVGVVTATTYVCAAIGFYLRSRTLVAMIGAHR